MCGQVGSTSGKIYMLPSTEQERQDVVEYMASQSKEGDPEVEFVQKVYSERLHSITHEIWDVHETGGRRWWVITNPMNLYTQDQFPNMDLALTFHVGLCLRIPRSDRPALSDNQVEPFIACWRAVEDARAAYEHAEETEDFQGIGVRCREALVGLIHAAQDLLVTPPSVERPKRSEVKAWTTLIADLLFVGEANHERRRLMKSAAENAWTFANWLAHARNAQAHDAEAALEATEVPVSLYTMSLIRHFRGVPERCPACGSHRLSSERAHDPDNPEDLYERPACQKCSWRGKPALIPPEPPRPSSPPPPPTECVIMTRPLRESPSKKRER
jgi:hypothetical protein